MSRPRPAARIPTRITQQCQFCPSSLHPRPFSHRSCRRIQQYEFNPRGPRHGQSLSAKFSPLSHFATIALDSHVRARPPPTRTGRIYGALHRRRRFSALPLPSGASLGADDATIYALSSAPGKAGIAVIRISGPACLDIYRGLCPDAPKLKPRYAAVRTLHDPEAARVGAGASADSADVLDAAAVVLFFPAPRTVTGEDVLELHVHGGPATVRAVLSAIPRCTTTSSSAPPGSSLSPAASIRYAEPGEFTRRAFLNDRLDLAQVEALGDALDAETEQQRRAAVSGSGGRLGATYEGWRAQLLAARAELEALIDFSEDQHFDESPRELLASVSAQVRTLLGQLRRHENAADRGSLLRGGIRVALVGPPNAGKSSLLNLVAGRAASIVSREPGTTRDVVEARLDLRGFLCTFADTAGFRGQEEPAQQPVAEAYGGSSSTGHRPPVVGSIEAEGIRRARQKAAASDVVVALACVEPAAAEEVGGEAATIRYDAETLRLAAQARQGLVVVNKCDLVSAQALAGLLAAFRAALDAAGSGHLPLSLISCRAAEEGPAGGAAAPEAAPPEPAPAPARVGDRQHSVPSARPNRVTGDGVPDAVGAPEAAGKLQEVVVPAVVAGGSVGSMSDTPYQEQTQEQKQRSSTLAPNLSGLPTPSSRTAAASASSSSTAAAATAAAAGSADPGGVLAFVRALVGAFAAMTDLPPDAHHLLGVTARQQQLLGQCRAHLEDFLAEAAGGSTAGDESAETRVFADSGDEASADIVLAAEHLRLAADCLARITGRGGAGDIEEVLGVIFEKFCVGK